MMRIRSMRLVACWLIVSSIWLAGDAFAKQPVGAQAPRTPTSIWQRITYPPLAIPGTDGDSMRVAVSEEVIVNRGSDRSYAPIGTNGVIAPSFLRLDVSWRSRALSCAPLPAPMPASIADAATIQIALYREDVVDRAKAPLHWVGVSNACSTEYSIVQFFAIGESGLDDAWFELQAAGRTYWIGLPYGMTHSPGEPGVPDPTRSAAQFPADVRIGEKDVLVPWVTVRYRLDPFESLDLVDACDGRARITPRGSSMAVEIHPADGRIVKGRDTTHSPGPQESAFDFPRLDGVASRMWDTVRVDVGGVRTILTVPSSLVRLDHRLANAGDSRWLPVPNEGC